MIKNTILLSFVISSFSSLVAQQNGGMWIPIELNEKEMKDLGMKISVKDIFDAKKPSIKDAVIHFDGGCTAEIISPKGLILTNHHCGYGEIQAHSSLEHDYLTDGFWAKNQGEELPNPSVTVDFIVDIKDVTNEVLKGQSNLTTKEIEQNKREVEKKFKLEPYQKVKIESMYYGNKFYAYVIETFKDIRLVGAPPSAIGKFGNDTDNWVWPRHTGDFSMFRIYADKNNKPAEYSKENVPYRPKYFLPISIKNKKENDFTFVFGFPGVTTEYLPSIAVEKIVKEIDPARISIRDVALKTLDEKMRTDDVIRIKYASKYASIANYWKKWIGEVEGLKKSNAIEKKKTYESFLISKNPEIKNTINKLENLYQSQSPFALNNAYYQEVIRNAETLRLANIFISLVENRESTHFSQERENSIIDYLENFYKDYDADLDGKVSAKVLALYQQKNQKEFLPKDFEKYSDPNENIKLFQDWSSQSLMTGKKSFNQKNVITNLKELLNSNEFISEIKKEPYYQLVDALRKKSEEVKEKYFSYQEEIDKYLKIFMKQQMETDKNRKFFPDANSTMRVTYGKIKGSQPKDAISYNYQTHLKGVLEKYIPNDYEFNVPQKLIHLYETKNFGIYKDETGDVPVNFTATNHTTGGNSGSPALDAQGNLIGLNFDRQWEGVMSDINYDVRFSRNIMVDTKYILFIIDKYADAKWLLNEMKIVK